MAIKFAQSDLDPAKQKAGYHHHDGTLPLFVSVYRSEWSFRRITDKQKTYPDPFSYRIGFECELNVGAIKTTTKVPVAFVVVLG